MNGKLKAMTEHIMWEEEDTDSWMVEADDSWFADFANKYYVVEYILDDIIKEVCSMS